MRAKELAIDYIDKKTNRKFRFPITLFKKPQTVKEYTHLQEVLDQLIDTVRDNEEHPLAPIMQIIGENLEQYDDEHNPPIGKNVSPIEMVRYLMETYALVQKDLAPIFGSQANVSKFLNGERALTKSQIADLKKRFGISADFFL